MKTSTFRLSLSLAILFLCTANVTLAQGDAAAKDAEKSQSDLEAFQGTWKPIRLEANNKPLPEEEVKKLDIVLVMKEGKYTTQQGGKKIDAGVYKLDDTKTPKQIDVTAEEGPLKGKTIPAIYKLEKDTLMVAYPAEGGQRPTEFKTSAGSGMILITYQRQSAG